MYQNILFKYDLRFNCSSTRHAEMRRDFSIPCAENIWYNSLQSQHEIKGFIWSDVFLSMFAAVQAFKAAAKLQKEKYYFPRK